MTDKSKWPDWLKNADTENAVVEISGVGHVIWRDGVWRDGDWRDGDWRGGFWHGGFWHGGDWNGGFWHGGDWRDGFWRDGYDNPTRCMFHVCGRGDKIKVGCKTYTISEAEALCDGGDLPKEAPSRNSEAGKLLRASVKAQIAWQRALEERI